MKRRDCPGPKSNGTATSLLLSFAQCGTPTGVFNAPILNPRTVLATFVHHALVVLRGVPHPAEWSDVVALHFMDAFKASGIDADALRGKDGQWAHTAELAPERVLIEMYDRVRSVAQDGKRQQLGRIRRLVLSGREAGPG